MASGNSGENATGTVVVSGQSSTPTYLKIGAAVLMIIAGLVGSSWGPYVAGALILLAGIGSFLFRKALSKWVFDSNKSTAGAIAGANASADQQKWDNNFDQVDDFLHRDRRSEQLTRRPNGKESGKK